MDKKLILCLFTARDDKAMILLPLSHINGEVFALRVLIIISISLAAVE
jgi:hypothetical protein